MNCSHVGIKKCVKAPILQEQHKEIIRLCMKQLEDTKQELKEWLVGLRYNMEGQKVKFGKARNNIHAIEITLFKCKDNNNMFGHHLGDYLE